LNREVIKYLAKYGGETIFIANRTYTKAQHLAQELNCSAVKFDKLYKKISECNIIISATSAPHLIIHSNLCQIEDKKFLGCSKAVKDRIKKGIETYSAPTNTYNTLETNDLTFIIYYPLYTLL